MTAQLIDGKKIAAQLKAEIREKIDAKLAMGAKQPGLAVILVGEDAASTIYVRNKREACEQVGIKSFYHHLSINTAEHELIELIKSLNQNPHVDGILLQLPLPLHIDAE